MATLECTSCFETIDIVTVRGVMVATCPICFEDIYPAQSNDVIASVSSNNTVPYGEGFDCFDQFYKCFSFLPGIGPKKVAAINDAGIENWQQFEAATVIKGLPQKLIDKTKGEMQRWQEIVEAHDLSYIATHLPSKYHWLFYRGFKNDITYFDIETTGLSRDYHQITMVGTLRDGHYDVLIDGEGLCLDALESIIDKTKMFVSFNGRGFDIPFLRHAYPQIDWDKPHLDLRFAAASVGYKCGLKQLEHELGIARNSNVEGVTGYEAVLLWWDYQGGNEGALELLKRYLYADVHNLEKITPIIVDKLMATI